MKRFFTIAQCVLLMFLLCSSVIASPGKKKKVNEKDAGTTITLVTSGTGDSKEEATKNALRSALEQTYGAFVSSNTQVVNDELIKDEIVSISSGNIVSYDELSFIDSNPKQVTVKAIVSITKLQNYAQNKGMAAELAGNTFAMNLKMEELNKKNQDVALEHMLEQTRKMSLDLFDYELSVGEPEKTPKGAQVPVTIRIMANNNTLSYYDYFHNTLSSLAVNKGKSKNFHFKQGLEIKGFEQFDNNGIVYELRGDASDPKTHNTIFEICNTIGEAVLKCVIVDNLGNISGFEKKENYHGVTRDYVPTNKLRPSQELVGYRDGYESPYGFPIERLVNVETGGVFFWLNAVKPKNGEKLYETKLFLVYSVDEIAKVSKIEVRPLYYINAPANDALQEEWRVLAEKGLKLYESNNYQEAYTCFKQSCEMNPKNALIHGYAGMIANNLAMSYDDSQYRKSLLIESLRYWDKAKELDPTESMIRWKTPRYVAYKNLYGPEDERTKAAGQE